MSDARPLSVLFLAENFLPHHGGSRTYYYRLLKRLAPHRVTVITRTHPDAAAFDSAQNFSIRRVSFEPSRALRPLRLQEASICARLLRAGLAEFRRGAADVVLCDAPGLCGVTGKALRALTGVPYGVFTHDEAVQSGRRIMPWIERFVLREADLLIAANAYSAAQLRGVDVAETRIKTLLPGLEREQFRFAPDQELKRRAGLQEKKVLMSIGRLVAHKGCHHMIAVLPELVKHVPETVYVIGGTGPQEEALRQLAGDLHVESHVRFLGYVPDAELANYWSIADVAVLLSCPGPGGKILEGFGMSNIEAAAAGKPVVAGRVGGTAQSVVDGKSGFLVDPTDSPRLVKLLVELLQNPRHAMEMGTYGRSWVQENFRIESRVAELVGFLQEMRA